MRIVAWNLAHQTREAPLPPSLDGALAALKPDVLVFNEFVDGESRSTLRAGLAKLGLPHVRTSCRVGKHNQVLIASAGPLEEGELTGPEMPGGAGVSNFLHVRLPEQALEVVGLRAPAYESADELHEYWRKLAALVRTTSDRRIVWIGDLNADPEAPGSLGGQYLSELRQEGWNVPRPSGPWSFVKGTRIDHLLASRSVRVLSAEYVASMGGIAVASLDKRTRVSDHAALVATLEDGASAQAPPPTASRSPSTRGLG